MKRLVNVLCISILFSGFPLSGMEGPSDGGKVKEPTSEASGRKYTGDGPLFLKTQTLDELVELKDWPEDIDIDVEKAKKDYEQLDMDIKTICETFADSRLRTSRPFNHAIILKGPPAIGKSTFGFIFGKKHNLRTIKVQANQLVDSWKDSGNQYLTHLLRLARNESEPIVIIIDEFHTITDRSKNEHNHDPGIIEAFFTALDELEKTNIFVVLTTNGFEGYPPSFYSRYNSYTFTMSNPSEEARDLIIDHLRKNGEYKLYTNLSEDEWQRFLVNLTHSFNYREIKDLFVKANQLACKEATGNKGTPNPYDTPSKKQHFEKAAKKIKGYRLKEKYERLKKFCKDHHQVIIFSGLTVAGLSLQYFLNRKDSLIGGQRHSESLAHQSADIRRGHWIEKATLKKSITWLSDFFWFYERRALSHAGAEAYEEAYAVDDPSFLPHPEHLSTAKAIVETEDFVKKCIYLVGVHGFAAGGLIAGAKIGATIDVATGGFLFGIPTATCSVIGLAMGPAFSKIYKKIADTDE